MANGSMNIFSFTFSISISVTGIFLPTTTMTVLPHKSTPENEKKSFVIGLYYGRMFPHTHCWQHSHIQHLSRNTLDISASPCLMNSFCRNELCIHIKIHVLHYIIRNICMCIARCLHIVHHHEVHSWRKSAPLWSSELLWFRHSFLKSTVLWLSEIWLKVEIQD